MSDHRSELKRAVALAGQSAERRYKASHPDAERLKIRTELNVYVPRAKDVKDVPVKAVARFLRDPASLQETNSQLASALGRDIGRRIPSNILTESFYLATERKIDTLLKERGISLDLSLHNTASKVKKALKARMVGAVCTADFVGSISFSDDAVTVGDKAYPIQSSRRIHVGKRKINVDALRALLLG